MSPRDIRNLPPPSDSTFSISLTHALIQNRVFGRICGRKNGEGAEERRPRDSLWK
jgi:hypothetical protein